MAHRPGRGLCASQGSAVGAPSRRGGFDLALARSARRWANAEASRCHLEVVRAESREAEAGYPLGHSAHLGTFRATRLRSILGSLGTFFSTEHALAQVGSIESTVNWLHQSGLDPKRAIRQAGCLDGAFPWIAYCASCDRAEWELRFGCGHRCCEGCHSRYHRRKARELREALGPQEWLGYLTITIHPYYRPLHTAELMTQRLKELAKALGLWFGEVVPVGAIAVHLSGKSDPWTHHPHYNILIGSRAYDAERHKLTTIGPKWLEPWAMKAWRDQLSLDAWGIGRCDVQGYWEYRDTEVKMGHALKYAVRSQGDGNPRARHFWTPDRARLLRPFGYLATGKRSTWSKLNPWPSEEEKIATLGWDESATERCRSCGSGLREINQKNP